MNKAFLRFSNQDQILFAKRLAILMKAGIPIVEALRMLQLQANSRSARQIFQILVQDVENGQYLSTSLQQFRKLFGEFAINLIRVGEVSGSLGENLEYIAEELKKKQALRRKVIGSLVYPVFIVIATFGIAGLLTVYVFPKILPIFASLKYQLPWSTRTLIAVNNVLLRHGLTILASFAALIILLVLATRVKSVRIWIDGMILRMPLLGSLSQGYHMANFCRTFAILLRSNVMIVEAATITANASTNLVYRRELLDIAKHLTGGGKISGHMNTRKRLFPPILSQMVSVGERAGTLSETLSYLAELYENEVEDLTKNLSNVIEPVLMIFMGVIVGFIAISIITPIYGITQNIHP